MTYLIKIDELNMFYKKKQVLYDISFELGKKEILSIVGESGSGKSSILRAIYGIMPQTARAYANKFEVLGESIFSNPIKNKGIRNRLGKKIGVVFQEPGSTINPNIKIGKQIIQMFGYNFNLDKDSSIDIGKNVLESVKLDPDFIWESYSYSLSGGMKQRVSIAMALMLKPDIMIMDEPTSALDATVQKKIMDEIKKLHKEIDMSMIMVTHNLAMAYNISDRMIVLKDGKIVDMGTSKEVVSNPKSNYTKKLIKDMPRF